MPKTKPQFPEINRGPKSKYQKFIDEAIADKSFLITSPDMTARHGIMKRLYSKKYRPHMYGLLIKFTVPKKKIKE